MKLTNDEWKVLRNALLRAGTDEKMASADRAVAVNLMERCRIEICTEAQRKL